MLACVKLCCSWLFPLFVVSFMRFYVFLRVFRFLGELRYSRLFRVVLRCFTMYFLL